VTDAVSGQGFAEQGLAPDCLQRPLLRRFRFQQQVKPSVRRPRAGGGLGEAPWGLVAGVREAGGGSVRLGAWAPRRRWQRPGSARRGGWGLCAAGPRWVVEGGQRRAGVARRRAAGGRPHRAPVGRGSAARGGRGVERRRRREAPRLGGVRARSRAGRLRGRPTELPRGPAATWAAPGASAVSV
jgi:hypothetical protein